MNSPDANLGAPGLHQILVVDDEEIVLVALRETLQRAGYRVTATSEVTQAVEMVRESPFSVIITDQQMPRMTGLEFLAQAKELQPDATRILITAVLNLSTVIDAINKGEIYRFVIKPWLREELMATVKNAVQRYDLICKNKVLQAATLAMNEKLTKLNAELEVRIETAARQQRELEKLNRALADNLGRSVELSLKTMETFYPTLGSQARRVFGLCRAMEPELKLSAEAQQALEICAWLHDIGLVGVSRQLIRKWDGSPGSLTEAESALIEHHPVLGEELVGFVHHLDGVGEIIRAHHERFDGQGYPDGLAGERIPYLARVLAVAVGYAQSNHEQEVTIELMRQRRGTFYDPEIVDLFLKCLPKAVVPRKEREVRLGELRPGMVLAKGIYTAGGMLLIPDGQELNATYIDKLRNHHRISPIAQSLLVYC